MGGVPVRTYEWTPASGNKNRAVLIYFHGGGFVNFDRGEFSGSERDEYFRSFVLAIFAQTSHNSPVYLIHPLYSQCSRTRQLAFEWYNYIVWEFHIRLGEELMGS